MTKGSEMNGSRHCMNFICSSFLQASHLDLLNVFPKYINFPAFSKGSINYIDVVITSSIQLKHEHVFRRK